MLVVVWRDVDAVESSTSYSDLVHRSPRMHRGVLLHHECCIAGEVLVSWCLHDIHTLWMGLTSCTSKSHRAPSPRVHVHRGLRVCSARWSGVMYYDPAGICASLRGGLSHGVE